MTRKVSLRDIWCNQLATGNFDNLKDCVVNAVANRLHLREANLREANLCRADLREANLCRADLREAKIRFKHFPSISLLSNLTLGTVSAALTLELMRRDASAHPNPDSFNVWAKGGPCPYKKVMVFWNFNPERALWSPGKPQMSDVELIKTICSEMGWGIAV